MRALAALIGAVAVMTVSPATASSADDPILAALEGRWVGVGAVEGEAVTYKAEGRFALMGEFLVFSMVDASDPPA
ncbi:MAG: hypothetical protein WD076_06090 [Parvularculaceae bacterium]